MPALRSGPALVLAATLALGGCTAYDGFGYSGVSVGVGSGGYYAPYRYDPYGYYGWYDGYYYPGAGYYIYDRYGSRYRWDRRHRRYWEARRGDRDYGENWSGYDDRRADLPDWRPVQRRMLEEQRQQRQTRQTYAPQQRQQRAVVARERQEPQVQRRGLPDWRGEQRRMVQEQREEARRQGRGNR